jgi:hypothetical protein
VDVLTALGTVVLGVATALVVALVRFGWFHRKRANEVKISVSGETIELGPQDDEMQRELIEAYLRRAHEKEAGRGPSPVREPAPAEQSPPAAPSAAVRRAPSRPKDIRLIGAIALSVVLGIWALVVLSIPGTDATARQAASVAIGALCGYWLSSSTK